MKLIISVEASPDRPGFDWQVERPDQRIGDSHYQWRVTGSHADSYKRAVADVCEIVWQEFGP